MSQTIADRIADLESINLADLRTNWERAFERPAPKHMSGDLLMRSLAYHVQEQMEGGLSKAALKRLAALANPGGDENRTMRPIATRPRPGTRLVREWRGEVHHVTVREDGFEYRGMRFASLSKIAREITGTRWSGPLFFGLRKVGSQTEAVNHGR